jgi:hypothetical protein
VESHKFKVATAADLVALGDGHGIGCERISKRALLAGPTPSVPFWLAHKFKVATAADLVALGDGHGIGCERISKRALLAGPTPSVPFWLAKLV